MGNKVNYGLCSVYYAIMHEDTSTGDITYDRPVAWPGAVKLTATPRGDAVEFEADNVTYYRSQPNDGYDIALENANPPESFEIDVMHMQRDSDGVLYERQTQEQTRIALLGEFQGDAHNKRFVFFNVLPQRSTIERESSKQRQPKTNTINMTADPRSDGYVKASTTESVSAGVYAAWFTAVQSAPATLTNGISPASASFSRASAADKVFTVTNGIVTGVRNGAAALGITEYSFSGGTLTIKSAYLAALDNGTYAFTATCSTGGAVAFGITVGA